MECGEGVLTCCQIRFILTRKVQSTQIKTEWSHFLLFPLSGTYFILYDFLDHFKKDNRIFLQRAAFLNIIDTIFGDQWPVSQLEKEAIIFQVKTRIKFSTFYLHHHNQMNPLTHRTFMYIVEAAFEVIPSSVTISVHGLGAYR